MLAEVWRDFRRRLLPITASTNVQEKRIELITGGVLDMWSLDTPDAARGRKYKRIAVDEAAMVADLEEAWQAVIRPTLTDYEGDAWFLSTPKGANFFRRLYDWGQESDRPDWRSWCMPTVSNPYLNPGEVEAARLEVPERIFAQEYLAVFLESAGGVFRRVMECATLPGLATPDPSRSTVGGLDWAKVNDWTVLTLLDAKTKELVGWERFNQVDWHVQRSRITAAYEAWRPKVILAERNSIGDPNIEALQRQKPKLPVRGFVTTNATKAEIIEDLALAIETHQIAYPNLPQLIAELQAFEMDRLPSGLVRYSAPAGSHDDCVMSLALAYHALKGGAPIPTTELGETRPSTWGRRR